MTSDELDDLVAKIMIGGVLPDNSGKGSAHVPIARALHAALKATYPEAVLYGEGLSGLGCEPIPEKYRGRFAGSQNWPDMALVLPVTDTDSSGLAIAIEVDRARGFGGASLRNALTKGWFNVLTGKFNRCLVLLYCDPGCTLEIDADAEEILERFQNEFRTKVLLFPPVTPSS
jgi:hypothetical protein